MSIPLNESYEIRKRVSEFYGQVDNLKPKGYDCSIQVPVQQLHLTLVMLKLYNKSDLNLVVDLLKKMSKKIYDLVETRSLVVQLKGVEIMNDDPTAVDVLYMKRNLITFFALFNLKSLIPKELSD